MTTDQIEKQIEELGDFKSQAAYIRKNLVPIQEAFTAKNNAINAKLEGKIGPDDLEQRSRVRLNAVDRLGRQIEIKGFDPAAVEKAFSETRRASNDEVMAAVAKAKRLDKETPKHEQVLVTVYRDMLAVFAS